jgi:hypothetical protein
MINIQTVPKEFNTLPSFKLFVAGWWSEDAVDGRQKIMQISAFSNDFIFKSECEYFGIS